MNPPLPLRPNRIRTVERPFAWIPCRLLINGLFADMSDQAKLLYTFLCLAADRKGLSYYGDKRIQSNFQLKPDSIDDARNELIHKDLIAYDGSHYQVLSLPSTKPEPTQTTKRTGEPERFSDILSRIANATR